MIKCIHCSNAAKHSARDPNSPTGALITVCDEHLPPPVDPTETCLHCSARAMVVLTNAEKRTHMFLCEAHGKKELTSSAVAEGWVLKPKGRYPLNRHQA